MLKNKYKTLVHIILISIFCLLAYANTFDVPFQFDDNVFILSNPLVKNLNFFFEPAKAKDVVPEKAYNGFQRRYIGYLTFALNYKLSGTDAAGYHVFNLSVHFINALLVYFLVIFSFETPHLKESSFKSSANNIALFSSLFFACHPVQTQAVTYIWQRVTSLASMFYLLSLVLYIRWRLSYKDTEYRSQNTEEKRNVFHIKSMLCYLSSVICAILAMKTKEISFTLPVVIMLYEFLFFNRPSPGRILYLIPFLLTMPIVPLDRITADKPFEELIGDVAGATRVQTDMPRLDYMFTQFRVIVTYIRLIFLPINQTLDYDYPVYRSFFDLRVLASFFFLLLIFSTGIFLVYRHKKFDAVSRLIAFGIFWFFITLSVESSIIPIVDVIFEHRLYLPSVGAFAAIIAAVFLLLRGSIEKSKIILTLGIVVIILTIGTYMRNNIWQNEISLWEDVVSKSPNNARGYNNLGLAYSRVNLLVKALDMFTGAVELKPDYAEAYNNRGVMYGGIGQPEKAIVEFGRAIKLKPDYAEAYNHLGAIYGRAGRFERAVKEFDTAIKLNLRYTEAYNNRGLAYMGMIRHEKAIEDFNRAITLNPGYATAYVNRGSAYAEMKKNDGALSDFKKACELGRQEGCGAYRLVLEKRN
ncbi:MAG TPA: tetratricopeptide repeat-containing protein [Nitrospiraceae bacterium]|nr:MAG: hypothetical protein A2Z82_08025 [Nitrospirae bacterium GWA2_46_11]OGW23589.1 MAG: hypothetical protein A2X55_01020 [Nitrospirae bacterium GWB2_47_37]HAK88618.1 tetratricopeptide repeat-containing protein [Nitrospiraceae bacterium]HCZ11048.1 tetratricopeptide repeat-containing protein [Nitrospiraceae bacterium]